MASAPVQPKKPAGGGFGQFMNEKRAEYIEKTKGQPISAVTKMGGEEWKKLSEAEKAPYMKKFEEAKKKYEADFEAFIAAGGVKQKGAAALRSEKRKAKEAKAAKKAAKDPNKPQMPVGGAFGCYSRKNRAAIAEELKGKPVTFVTKAASEKWKALSASEKEPYEKEYQGLMEAYKKAMESYTPPPKPEAEEAEEPPAKKAKIDKAAAAAAKKAEKAAGKPKAKARGKAKGKAAEEEALDIPKTVMAKAEKEDVLDNLQKLLRRDDIKNASITPAKALDALCENRGLLHQARRALLGA